LLPFAVLFNFAVGLRPAISLTDDSTHDVSSHALPAAGSRMRT
jgi:hypothetical protein